MKVSAYLRGKPLDRYTDLKLQVYKNKLELLEHATEDRDSKEALDYGRQGSLAFGRLKRALGDSRRYQTIDWESKIGPSTHVRR